MAGSIPCICVTMRLVHPSFGLEGPPRACPLGARWGVLIDSRSGAVLGGKQPLHLHHEGVGSSFLRPQGPSQGLSSFFGRLWKSRDGRLTLIVEALEPRNLGTQRLKPSEPSIVVHQEDDVLNTHPIKRQVHSDGTKGLQHRQGLCWTELEHYLS